MPRAKEIKIRIEDRPGMLGEVALALSEKKVNLRAVNAWVENGEGVIRMVVDNVGAAKRALAARGWKAESTASAWASRDSTRGRLPFWKGGPTRLKRPAHFSWPDPWACAM